jgi:4,5-dihydroxyphthalate decarboxylase
VNLDKVNWLTIEDAHVTEFRDPSNCERLPAGSKLADMMMSGELAAAILGGDMPKDPRVQSLIPDAAVAAQQWYQREHVIPINHMFVVREDLSKERPDVVRDIYRMLVESRKFAPESATRPPVGLEPNRKGLELAIRWSFEQKIIPRMLSVDELFDATTAALGS